MSSTADDSIFDTLPIHMFPGQLKLKLTKQVPTNRTQNYIANLA